MTALFRGTVAASAIVLDPELIGMAEAQRRAMRLTAGSLDVRTLPDGRWLVMLREPVEQRCEQAPGVVLVERDGGLAMPGLPTSPSAVTWQTGSVRHTADLRGLTRLPTYAWVDLSSAAVYRLQPADIPKPTAVQPVELETPAPDLRAAARIPRKRTRQQARLSRRTGSALRRPISLGVLAVLLVLGVIALVRGLVAALGGGDRRDIPWAPLFLLLWLAVGFSRRRAAATARRSGAGGRLRQPGALRRWFSRLFATPARGMLNRRQQRYLESLTQKFRRRDWHAALREAIGLGEMGGSATWLRLRMPKARETLQLQLIKRPGGSVAMGDTGYAYLRAMYAAAAKDLETADLIDEAAFVHAELLNDVPAAATLLERQGRLHLAAELAEARKLPTDLVVRLWWRAGDRDRAVAVARARGGFAGAISRLAEVDRDAARDLRRAWVDTCQRAGDHLGAVAAAWPEPDLRHLVLPDLEAGMTLGGAVSGALFAHFVSEHPSDSVTRQALALLGARDRELHRARSAFIGTYAGLDARDPTADRQICTAAVRSALAVDPTPQLRGQIKELAKRADPLLKSDLPPLRANRARSKEPLELQAPETAGELPVHDAVALPGRAILLATGDTGVRLTTLDGRARARWDVPAQQIVIADNGGSALLLRHAGAICEVSRLDLATRRVRPWSVLPQYQMLGSFDGGTALIVDGDGIALLDVLGDRPRILWRELDRKHRVLRIGRTPGELTALIEVPPPAGKIEPLVQLWSWELPSMTLRVRRNIDQPFGVVDVAAWAGTVAIQSAGTYTDPKLSYFREYRNPVVTPIAPDAVIAASGEAFAVEQRLSDRWMCTVDLGDRPAALHASFPPGERPIGMREHAGIITLWDAAGRIVAAEPRGSGLLAAFKTSL